MKIRKNDTVIVIAGASRGTKGKVLDVFPEISKVLVEGVNVKKKHMRQTDKKKPGGLIVERAYPISVSNVALLDPKTDKATRIGWKTDAKGKKVRVARKSGQEL